MFLTLDSDKDDIRDFADLFGYLQQLSEQVALAWDSFTDIGANTAADGETFNEALAKLNKDQLAELALGLGERLFRIAAASRAIAAILHEHAEKFNALPGAKEKFGLKSQPSDDDAKESRPNENSEED